MKRTEDTSGQEKRYIGLDVHKHYVTVGGMNAQQEMVLRPRNVEMERFKAWAAVNLCQTDEVVLEATSGCCGCSLQICFRKCGCHRWKYASYEP